MYSFAIFGVQIRASAQGASIRNQSTIAACDSERLDEAIDLSVAGFLNNTDTALSDWHTLDVLVLDIQAGKIKQIKMGQDR